ncbi:MAG: FAD-dependent oxidoreductase [Saprospirales bacterium]|nr:FAD-dependent oxidoreductase [Saprospirales bacterium]
MVEELKVSLSRRKFLGTSGKAILHREHRPQSIIPFLEKIAPHCHHRRRDGGNERPALFEEAGLEATVYEASGRTGGRMFTVKGVMGEEPGPNLGRIYRHPAPGDAPPEGRVWPRTNGYRRRLRAQTQQRGLLFDNRHYTLAQVVDAFRGFADKLQADIDKLPDEITYRTADPDTVRFDRMNLSEYLGSIGVSGWMKSLLENAYEAEYGLAPEEQSAINLLFLISTDTEGGHFDIFGESDERYKIKGGNQSIPDAIAKKYPSDILLNRSLEMLDRRWTHFRLKFSGMTEEVKADFVVMTIPFAKLQEVEVRVNMPKVKEECIRTIGFGTNSR